MTPRERVAAGIAATFAGHCTCRALDTDMDCPWCQVYGLALERLRVGGPEFETSRRCVTVACGPRE
jgi:hypothetical protein